MVTEFEKLRLCDCAHIIAANERTAVGSHNVGGGVNRLDKQRTVRVMANVDQQILEPRSAVRKIRADYLPEMLSRYPGVSMELDGSSKEEEEALQGGFLSR